MQQAQENQPEIIPRPLSINVSENQIQRQADQSGAQQALAQAQAMVIDSPEALSQASAFIKEVTAAEKRLNETRLNLTRPIDEAKNKIMGLFKPAVDCLNQAKMLARRKAGAYQEEERRRREQEAREAAEKAERERLRQQKLAEAALERGDTAKAEKFEAKAEQAATSVPVAEAPKTTGVALRTYYQVQVLNMKQLCAAVAEGKIPPHIVQLHQGEANKFASATKGAVEIPGCTIKKERR